MEERNKLTSIFKSNDPEELVVFRAASLQNEIRFYLNDTLHLAAVECEDGFTIKLEEEKAEECNKKSKHSAEHMMVNFLEINKRLPKNIEEVKKYSRFSSECGSRKLIEGIVEELIRSIIATVLTIFFIKINLVRH